MIGGGDLSHSSMVAGREPGSETSGRMEGNMWSIYLFIFSRYDYTQYGGSNYTKTKPKGARRSLALLFGAQLLFRAKREAGQAPMSGRYAER